MKKHIALLMLCAVFCSFNGQANKLYSCYYCTAAKLNVLIDTHVQSTKTLETMIVLDAGKATTTEIRLRPAGNYTLGAPIPYMYEIYSDEPYLQSANNALAELKSINLQLAQQAQLGITLPAETGYATVADALRNTADFERVLSNRFNSGEFSDLNEIARRADNQLQLLSSSLGFGYSLISASLGTAVKDSSWVVTLSDGSRITVDITFKVVTDKLTIVTTADRRTAIDSKGVSVPLAKESAIDYGFGGNFPQAVSYAEFMRSMGINGSVPYNSDYVNCTVSKTIAPYSDKVTYIFSCK